MGDFFTSALGDCRSSGEHFNAAALAARTKWAARVDAKMTAFGRRASSAVIDHPVEHDAGADTRSDGGVKNIGIAAPSAPFSFGESGGIRIVVDFNGGAGIKASDLVGQGILVPGRQVWGI